MAKQFNAHAAAQAAMAGTLPNKLSLANSRALIECLAAWTRQAHIRAKVAEDRLRELPNWESQYSMAQMRIQQLSRQINALETDRLARIQAQRDMLSQHEAAIKELQDKIATLKQNLGLKQQKLDAALDARNAYAVLVEGMNMVAQADRQLEALDLLREHAVIVARSIPRRQTDELIQPDYCRLFFY